MELTHINKTTHLIKISLKNWNLKVRRSCQIFFFIQTSLAKLRDLREIYDLVFDLFWCPFIGELLTDGKVGMPLPPSLFPRFPTFFSLA